MEALGSVVRLLSQKVEQVEQKVDLLLLQAYRCLRSRRSVELLPPSRGRCRGHAAGGDPPPSCILNQDNVHAGASTPAPNIRAPTLFLNFSFSALS